jgi:hypothetical protein
LSYGIPYPLSLEECLQVGELTIGHGGEADQYSDGCCPQAVRTDYFRMPDERPYGFPCAMKVQRAVLARRVQS